MKGLFAIDSNNWVKTIGVYIILILALLRFLIYPLHAAVNDRRAHLALQQETYMLKARILEQAQQAQSAGVTQDLDKARTALYPREARVSDIQSEMLATILKYSEDKGLTVLGFEMPEAAIGKKISEVPVVLRLAGSARSFVELLKSMKENKKTLAVKAMEISVSGQGMTFSMTVSAFRMEL
ncbi:MAG TPA: hypothetical protein VMT12_11710 [Syntrophales bacterium]|nr:hypothetical protein [Syntrophales bacterium]